jgi:hypothetical protein
MFAGLHYSLLCFGFVMSLVSCIHYIHITSSIVNRQKMTFVSVAKAILSYGLAMLDFRV